MKKQTPPAPGDPLVQAFETAMVDPKAFRHREHLYVAFCYLSAMPLEDAFARYVHHLRALTTALGVPGKFDANVTRAYLVLLDDAMRAATGATFDEVLAKNPALLERPVLPRRA